MQDKANATLPYPIVDSGQTACYDAVGEMPAPAPGADFYGQDAQYIGNQPSYTKSSDGLTVTDNVTGLMWQQSPDTNGDGVINVADKMTWDEAQAYPSTLNAKKFARLRRLAPAHHQGDVLAHPVRRHRPQSYGA